jgi:hypothetical protein
MRRVNLVVELWQRLQMNIWSGAGPLEQGVAHKDVHLFWGKVCVNNDG